MAAYGALVSLMNTVEQIMNHPRFSTFLDKNQIKSLGKKIDFLLDFLETYNSLATGKEVEDLESEIASVAHAAEDVIESHIVDQAQGESSHRPPFHLQNVIADMASIKEKVMENKEKSGFKDQQPTYSKSASSSRLLTTGKTTMVGFDDELIQLMDVLTGQQSSRLIIPIVGMGGIGKTTLARNVFENSLIVQHFDIRAWATISQTYSVREVVIQLLSCQERPTSTKTVQELGEQLYKSLCGRRYLIILDDMWSMQVLDSIKIFFPDNGNKSRVVLTTRLSDVATHCGSSCFRMNFLDEDKSWNIFRETVFEHGDCPPELESIGKKIVQLCKGLPLSIVVIGGLLRKSHRTTKCWQNVAKNIHSILNSGENEQCLNVLSLSYSHLPAHLKPCFLYMGTFQEDDDIRVSRLIKLWVAEGFLKPNGAQILEEAAEGYLNDLIDRNLILVGRRRLNGKIRSCHIHDLLRDLCIRVAQKEKFFRVVRALGTLQGMDKERRLVFHGEITEHYNSEVFHAFQSASLTRSLICKEVNLPVKLRLLRVFGMASNCTLEAIFENINLRYLTYQPLGASTSGFRRFPISLIWNLQTLIVRGGRTSLIIAPLEIWKMPQLRHVEFNKIHIPNPPWLASAADEFCVLGNLQTLLKVCNSWWTEDVCKRIPNIKKLHLIFESSMSYADVGVRLSHLSNLCRLHKLESLNIRFLFGESYMFNLLKNNLMFPSSLNKLTLRSCRLRWEDLTMIGSLPQLEVLQLRMDSVMGSEWRPVNGQFLRLKFLKVERCDLKSWTADSFHFPVLGKLVLRNLENFNEIPWGIGEIPTLELIRLEWCRESAVISAMKIKEEQEGLGNDGLQIQVRIRASSRKSFRERVETEGLAISNIQLEVDQDIYESIFLGINSESLPLH